jgi:hypothetical protein
MAVISFNLYDNKTLLIVNSSIPHYLVNALLRLMASKNVIWIKLELDVRMRLNCASVFNSNILIKKGSF